MPIVPKYTKQEFVKTPGVDYSASNPVRLESAYENNLTRAGRLLPLAVQTAANAAAAGGQKAPASSGVSRRREEDAQLRLREEAVHTAQKELGEKGVINVSSLESFAAKKLTPQTASGPAGRDMTVLLRAARETQAVSDAARARENAVSEEKLLRRVGSLVRSPQALEEYLSSQLPSYEARLAQDGVNEQTVRTSARAVRSQTVEENVCRLLAEGDWRAAQATLEKHGGSLPPAKQEVCSANARAEFARSQAEKLWEEVRLETGGDAAQIHQDALNRLQEPDGELNALSRRTLDALLRKEQALEHARAAQTLERAVYLPSAEALAVLAGQTALTGGELAAARRAAEFFDGDTTRTDASFFVQSYFGGGRKEHERALARGKISARDYVRLEAARHRRESGERFYERELLCRGIGVWMQKKGFSAQDTASAQYAVLSSMAPAEALGDVWKEVKNLLDV